MTRTAESLLGLLGGMLAVVGMAIQTLITFLHMASWKDGGWIAIYVMVMCVLVRVTVSAIPSNIQDDHRCSAKWMLCGGALSCLFSWFTAIAGVLLLLAGLLAIRKSRKGWKGEGLNK